MTWTKPPEQNFMDWLGEQIDDDPEALKGVIAELTEALARSQATVKSLNRRAQKAEKRFRDGLNYKLLGLCARRAEALKAINAETRQRYLDERARHAATKRQVRTLLHEKGQFRKQVRDLTNQRDTLVLALTSREDPE